MHGEKQANYGYKHIALLAQATLKAFLCDIQTYAPIGNQICISVGYYIYNKNNST